MSYRYRNVKGSWRIARLAGVNIDIHWSFSLIILWVVIQSAFEDREIWNTLLVLAAVMLVFVCIILHELGHALMALSLNVEVKNIMLLPIGGLVQIRSAPDRPLYEFLIAAAGPLVNLAIVIILMPALVFLSSPDLLNNLVSSPISATDTVVLTFFEENTVIGLVGLIIVANAVLFAFNLIPAYPMDGGRILRSALTIFLPYARATQISMAVGFGIAILLMALAFQRGNMVLLIVGLFILFGAQSVKVH